RSFASDVICQRSSDAPRAAKSGEPESRHHQRVDHDEADDPGRRAMLPFAPDHKGTVGGKDQKQRAGKFVEQLADDAPPDTQRDHERTPERRKQASGHGSILGVMAQMASLGSLPCLDSRSGLRNFHVLSTSWRAT